MNNLTEKISRRSFSGGGRDGCRCDAGETGSGPRRASGFAFKAWGFWAAEGEARR